MFKTPANFCIHVPKPKFCFIHTAFMLARDTSDFEKGLRLLFAVFGKPFLNHTYILALNRFQMRPLS